MQPKADYLLVRVDPAQEEHNGLHLVRKNHFRKGTVLSTGPGRWCGHQRVPIEVSAGERIAFLTWHQETRPGATLASAVHSIEGENVVLLQERDILMTWPSGEKEPEVW